MSRREVDFGQYTDCQPQNTPHNGRFLDHHTNVTSDNGHQTKRPDGKLKQNGSLAYIFYLILNTRKTKNAEDKRA